MRRNYSPLNTVINLDTSMDDLINSMKTYVQKVQDLQPGDELYIAHMSNGTLKFKMLRAYESTYPISISEC